jgi:glycolate oxidase FAD binding subunit
MNHSEALSARFGAEVEIQPARPTDALDGVQPQLVAAPRSEAAALELIKYCTAEKLAFVPRGSGTKWHAGAPPSKFDVLLSTRHLNQIWDHDEGNATVTAGAGIELDALNAEVGRKQQFCPIDDAPNGTLGGIAATNFSNAWRQKYGTPRDLITGLDVLLSDGRQLKTGAKVVKNVSGYDLPKIFIGSYGTLGIITRLTIRLRPYDVATQIRHLEFKDWEKLGLALEYIQSGPFEPTMLRAVVRPVSLHLYVRFDGPETAVVHQGERLGGEFLESMDNLVPASLCLLRAALPVARAGEWARAAHEARAQEVTWDAGVGAARAAFYTDLEIGSVQSLRAKAESLGGHLIVERAPVAKKNAELVWGAPRPEARLMRQVKAAYDPHSLFSPGRFVAGI